MKSYSFAEKLFSLKNYESEYKYYKVLNILGLKLKIKRKVDSIDKNLLFICKFLTQNYVRSIYEIERCKEFYKEMQDFNMVNKYKKLIKGLDKKSITEVSKILGRVNKIATSKTNELSIFPPNEIKQIQEIKKDLDSCIIKLSESCFAYKEYLLPINHFEASVFYYKHNIESLNLEKIKNKAFIDAGAFIGDSAIVLEKYTNDKVYSFEPTTEYYNCLLKTIELNHSTKIVPMNIALGSKDEELEIHLQSSGSSINRIIETSPSKESIKVTYLDKIVEEKNLEVGLIKVDIEGFEQEFLKGAEKTIKTQKPALLISIYHNASDFFDIKPLIESWNLGYKFKIERPVDGGIRGETLLIAEI